MRLLAPCACVRFRLLGALALCHVCLAYQISRISKQSCLGSAPSLSFLFALLLNSIEIQNTSIVKARFLIEILEKWNGRGKKPKMDDHHSSCLRLACVDLSRRHQEPTKLSQRFTLPIIFQITTDPLINTMAADGETINLVSTSIII